MAEADARRRKIKYQPLICAVVLILIQLPFLAPEIDWYGHSATATGVVVRLRDGNHKPDIVFTTSNGERLSVPGASTWRTFEVGDDVIVRYDVRAPRKARIDGVWNLWGWHIFATLALLIFLQDAVFGTKPAKRD
jgi:hypothetical protein